jgi:hypothetical protein
MIKQLPLALAAASLTVAPVAAQAAPAPIERGSEAAVGTSEMRGGFSPALVVVALAAVGMLFLILTDDDDDAVSA